jgi:hypothetical protein
VHITIAPPYQSAMNGKESSVQCSAVQRIAGGAHATRSGACERACSCQVCRRHPANCPDNSRKRHYRNDRHGNQALEPAITHRHVVPVPEWRFIVSEKMGLSARLISIRSTPVLRSGPRQKSEGRKRPDP